MIQGPKLQYVPGLPGKGGQLPWELPWAEELMTEEAPLLGMEVGGLLLQEKDATFCGAVQMLHKGCQGAGDNRGPGAHKENQPLLKGGEPFQ